MAETIHFDEQNGPGFDAYLVRPEGTPRGALIVIHEIWGLNEHTEDVARRFAADGFLALAPSLLAETGVSPQMAEKLQDVMFNPAVSEQEKSQYQPQIRQALAPVQSPEFAAQTRVRVAQCFDYLTDQGTGKVGIVGYCFGGTYSYSLAADRPELAAAVPYYGHMQLSAGELSGIKAPVLAFYGETDHGLTDGVPEVKAQMEQAGVDYTAVIYPDAGHAFFNDSNPWVYQEQAAQDSWEKVLPFLAKNLG